MSQSAKKTDCVILGAGVIGLSLAVELCARGAQVVVLESTSACSQASAAAAGMIAAHDPHNPPELGPLSRSSEALYEAYLERIQHLSGLPVPFQTHTTHQHHPDGSITRLAERSIDPRQLGPALTAAVRNTTIALHENTTDAAPWHDVPGIPVVHATGAWHVCAFPTKGQMLRVELPRDFPLREVHRAEDIYIVPRTVGPQAGTALIGATVESVGFDRSTHPEALAALHARAAELLPQLAAARTVESWAGLRPDTPDHLPLLGQIAAREFVATGHFRNGILLAPVTAVLVADLLEGKTPALDLAAFDPHRFEKRSA